MDGGDRLVARRQGRGGLERRWTLWSALGASKVPSSPSVQDALQRQRSLTWGCLLYFEWLPRVSVLPGLGVQHVDYLDPDVGDEGDHGLDRGNDQLNSVGQVIRSGWAELRTSRP